MFDDDDGFDLFLGLILWVPYLAWLWIKLTFMLLEFVFGAVVAIGTFLYYIISEIFDFLKKMVDNNRINEENESNGNT
jgi:hypothetical protein